MVVIAKATQEAGEILETAQGFSSANLKLRIEVPGLALRSDGSLIGDDVAGHDVLASAEHLGTSSPGVAVGPDSTPTLSFTSGSEGKPRGVRGRHFSLACYFDWMAKTFKLSENDLFTMLSGIVHDFLHTQFNETCLPSCSLSLSLYAVFCPFHLFPSPQQWRWTWPWRIRLQASDSSRLAKF